MNQKVAKNVSSIIFDLGGVLFDIDYSLTQKAFIALGAKDFDQLYSQQKQEGFFDDFERGNITAAHFRTEVKKLLPGHLTDDDVNKAWNALLIGFPAKKVEFMKQLKKRYPLYLLSNTNDIHLPAVLEMMDAEYGKGIMQQMFHKEYYSCRMGMRKPNADIYKVVCDENDLNPANTVFIDDSIQNVVGAGEFGLQTLHFTPNVTSLEEFFN